MPSNDNAPPARAEEPSGSDAHGRAALLLVESLIHGLCEKATLTVDEAVEIAERAVSVQADLAEAADGADASMRRSYAMLAKIAASLHADSGRELSRPR